MAKYLKNACNQTGTSDLGRSLVAMIGSAMVLVSCNKMFPQSYAEVSVYAQGTEGLFAMN
jgi:hypothetical protein